VNKARDFFERQQLMFIEPDHSLFGHTILTTEIATVGNRNAKVIDDATEGILEDVG
jgi:hypothetical protein